MTTTPDYSCIAIVDLSYLFKRNYMGAGLKAPPDAGARRTLEDLAAIRDDVDHVILALDAPPYLRRDRFAAYKEHREEPPHEELQQKRALLKELERLGYVAAKVRGYEADDVIATLTRIYAEWCPEIRVYGPDKDIAQCIRANVIQIIPSSGKRQSSRRDAKACLEQFGCLPSAMPLWQALVGDASDGVPGVKGIGNVGATKLLKELAAQGRDATLEGLASMIAETKPPTKEMKLLAEGYTSFKLSLDLVTLDPNVPLDADALLKKREPSPDAEDSPDVDLMNFEGNTTPMPSGLPADDGLDIEPPSAPQARQPLPTPRVGADPNAEQFLREEAARREAAAAARQAAPAPAPAPANDAPATPPQTPPSPAPQAAPRATGGAPVAAPAPPAEPSALVQVAPPGMSPEDLARVLAAQAYGGANLQLQPTDLRGAWTISNWIAKSGLYSNFDTAQKVFVLVQRAAEMGIPVGVALHGFHIIENKLSASADFIRSLAERDPNCEYLQRIESTATRAVWETKHRRHRSATTYEYTIEEAQQIPSLWKLDRHGKPGNWVQRPRDMLNKTAASKLCREVFPGATMGLYCPEELGNSIITTVGEAA
jgi:5'-3' exonuclease